MKTKLSRRSKRQLKTVVIYILLSECAALLAGLVFFTLADYAYHIRVHYPEEWIAQFANVFSTYFYWFLIAYILLAFYAITYFFIKRIYVDQEEINQTIHKVSEEKVESVQMSDSLKEFENAFNHLLLRMQMDQRAAKEAEQKKNDLIVYLAHDLKTPLTSVIGYLTLLMEGEHLPEEFQKKYMAISLEKAERLEELINEFFEITRFNLTTLTLESTHTDLVRMLEQIVFEFQPMLGERGLICTVSGENKLPITCDLDKLQRVFDNLLKNAINYSYSDTEIVIDIEKAGEPDRPMAQIQVKNHGDTIPKEKLGRIFEQFFRLDSSRGSRTGGTGLGLAIAKEIVELHGGTIQAESQNEEICFVVQLPLG